MEEEMRQGMMGADVDTSPAAAQPMELTVSAREVSNNLQNLGEQERELITQLNVPQFRDFMSKIFGPEFGMLMEQELPEPPQPVSPQGESPAPTQGQGMMTQPPVTA